MTDQPCLTWDGYIYSSMRLTMPSGEAYAITEDVLKILTEKQWSQLYWTTMLHIAPKTAQAILQQATVPAAA